LTFHYVSRELGTSGWLPNSIHFGRCEDSSSNKPIRNDSAELDEEAVAEPRFDCFLPVEETWKEFWKKKTEEWPGEVKWPASELI
jgi:hypothetical protein